MPDQDVATCVSKKRHPLRPERLSEERAGPLKTQPDQMSHDKSKSTWQVRTNAVPKELSQQTGLFIQEIPPQTARPNQLQGATTFPEEIRQREIARRAKADRTVAHRRGKIGTVILGIPNVDVNSAVERNRETVRHGRGASEGPEHTDQTGTPPGSAESAPYSQLTSRDTKVLSVLPILVMSRSKNTLSGERSPFATGLPRPACHQNPAAMICLHAQGREIIATRRRRAKTPAAFSLQAKWMCHLLRRVAMPAHRHSAASIASVGGVAATPTSEVITGERLRESSATTTTAVGMAVILTSMPDTPIDMRPPKSTKHGPMQTERRKSETRGRPASGL